jgi:4-amino-4-deoxy-L-arabinose transferase-like glycosyltransferase
MADPAVALRRWRERRRWVLLERWMLVGLAALAFLPFLGNRDIVSSHEARVAQTARQMAASGWPWDAKPLQIAATEVKPVNGVMTTVARTNLPPWHVNPWLIPVLNGQARLQKPPLPYWCVALGFKLFGFSEGVARFPSALMGALATLVMYDLGRRLLGNLGGWCAALVWCSSYFVIDEFRKVMADPYLAFLTLTAIWCWVRLSRYPRWGWVIGFYVSLALGGLSKGPAIFLHVIVAVAAYQICFRRRFPGAFYQHLVGVLLLLVIALPWPMYLFRHVPDALGLWRYELDNLEKARPWFYYLPGVFQISLPWTAVWVIGCLGAWFVSKRMRARGRFALEWFAVILIFFTMKAVKKNAYLLPMMPAQSLLIAQGLLFLLMAVRRVGMIGPYPIFLMVQRVIALGFAPAVIVLAWKFGWEARIVVAILAVAAVACVLWADDVKMRSRQRAWMLGVAGAYTLLIVAFFNFYRTPVDNLGTAKYVAGELTPMLRQADVTLSLDYLPEEVSVYLPLDLRYDARSSRVLVVVDDRDQRPVEQMGQIPKTVDGNPVASVRRLPMKTAPGERARWKVFELRVNRSVRSAIAF